MDDTGFLSEARSSYLQACRCGRATLHKLAKTPSSQNASQFFGAALAIVAQRFLGKTIQLAVLRVLLDLTVKARCLELLEQEQNLASLSGGNCSTAFSISSTFIIVQY
jgi:hypothetical protein